MPMPPAPNRALKPIGSEPAKPIAGGRERQRRAVADRCPLLEVHRELSIAGRVGTTWVSSEAWSRA